MTTPPAHPNHFCEENTPTVDLIRAINKPCVNHLHCAPHSFHPLRNIGDRRRPPTRLMLRGRQGGWTRLEQRAW